VSETAAVSETAGEVGTWPPWAAGTVRSKRGGLPMEGGVTTHGAAVTDGADHDDRRMANGTRVAVHNAGFGVSQASRFVC
jgi:hypothetical protein